MNRLFCLALSLVLIVAGAPFAAAQAGAPSTSVEEIKVTLGKSLVLDYPEDVARISTSNPEVVDYVPVSTREILLHAKALGVATVVVWAKSGQRTFYNLLVEYNLEPIRKLIRESFPAEQIQVSSSKDSVVLTGQISSQQAADRVLQVLLPLSKTVVNNMRVRSAPVEKQIVLKVKFAEVNRQAMTAFGINLVSTGALNTPGRITTGQFPSASPTGLLSGGIPGGLPGTTSSFTLSDALNIFAFRPDLNFGIFIKDLQTKGLLQILAEPNLVTSNGKEASFLVGGEFPIPVLQGGANSGAVTIQFREFGIRLHFNPLLTDNNTMKMYVKPEVSTIDLNNAVTVSGFRIPALATRRIESNIELAPGQSFIIGGLIDDRTQENLSRMPGLASIPVLGVLFKSREETRTKTELLVMVTPEFIDPLNPGDPKGVLGLPRGSMDPSMYSGGAPYTVFPTGSTVRSPMPANSKNGKKGAPAPATPPAAPGKK
jgi:pilus assembly protein CpaC